MTLLAVILFLEKWRAVVAKHGGADLPNLIFADGGEAQFGFSYVDFGSSHCCSVRKVQLCVTGFLPACSCDALVPTRHSFCNVS